MNWADFTGKKVGLLGAGAENLSLIPHFQRLSAKITVLDRERNQQQQARYQDVDWITGADYLLDLQRYDYLFRSPGLPTAVVNEAVDRIPPLNRPVVTSAMNLFFALKPCPVIGVTGTKGKGTTATILYTLLRQSDRPVFLAGNIGSSIFDQWASLNQDSLVVLELSSFQLEDLVYSPEVAVILPITPDHLQPLSDRSPNYHPSFADYVRAKAAIARYQQHEDRVYFAQDNSPASSIGDLSSGQRIAVSQQNPQAACYVDDSGRFYHHRQEVIDFAQVGLSGRHYFLDAALATAVALDYNFSTIQLKRSLREFKPLPHRLEKVTTLKGVRFIDDSHATTPESAAAALTAFDQPVIWIAGGSSKGADFNQLAQRVASSTVKQVILIGQEAPRITIALNQVAPKLPVRQVTDLEEAVELAFRSAVAGEVVLLSPACASTDMFKNADERGEIFQAAVKRLRSRSRASADRK